MTYHTTFDVLPGLTVPGILSRRLVGAACYSACARGSAPRWGTPWPRLLGLCPDTLCGYSTHQRRLGGTGSHTRGSGTGDHGVCAVAGRTGRSVTYNARSAERPASPGAAPCR